MRIELLDALRAHDNDPDVRVTIIRGAGALLLRRLRPRWRPHGRRRRSTPRPATASGPARPTSTWFSFWDLAKPVIAQVHGYAIAGATELAQACDLVYVADDARISYPIVRVASPPDWQYHTVLLGPAPGHGAHAHRRGHHRHRGGGASAWPTGRSRPTELEAEVLAVAERVAGVPSDLAQINKRMVHRQAEVMGVRAAMRAGNEFQALAGHQQSVEAFKADPLAMMKKHNAADAARREAKAARKSSSTDARDSRSGS